MALIYISGCYDEVPLTDSQLEEYDWPEILTVTPENGATGVGRSASYGIKFDSPMDTASVSENFYLSGGSDMQNWMDSMMQGQGMGHMGQSNRDSMMHWMDSIAYSGHLEWNDALDSCAFHPDSLLLPNADHMLFLDWGVRDVDGYYMVLDTLEYEAVICRFKTASQ